MSTMEKLEEMMIENRDVLVRLKNGTPKSYLFGHIHCPVNGWDCPYFDTNGCCMMYPDNNPIEECDDFATFWDTEDDYICYEKH